MLPPHPSASAMIQNYNSSLPPHYPGSLLPTMVKPKSRFDSRGRFQTATVTTPTNGAVALTAAQSARIPGRDAQSAMMMQREHLNQNDSEFKMMPTPNINLTTRVNTAMPLGTGRNNLNSKSAMNNFNDAPKRSSSIYRINLG